MKQHRGVEEDLARRILACESGKEAPSRVHVAARAIERLRLQLTRFLGTTGFLSLLTRALAIATTQVPWLVSVKVKEDGSLAGLNDAAQMQRANDASKGGVVLLTQLLALLVTFIGETMTRNLVQDIWSEARLGDLSVGAKESTG